MYQKRYWCDATFEAVDQLARFFTPRGESLTHVVFAWVLAQPSITSAIIGASKLAQLIGSLKGVDLQLDEEELKFCNEIWYQLPREQDSTIARRSPR